MFSLVKTHLVVSFFPLPIQPFQKQASKSSRGRFIDGCQYATCAFGDMCHDLFIGLENVMREHILPDLALRVRQVADAEQRMVQHVHRIAHPVGNAAPPVVDQHVEAFQSQDVVPPHARNKQRVAGLHFGYPYCHQGDTPDPEFGQGKSCTDYTAPALTLGAHVAALGLTFYTGDMFPEEYRNQLFIAQHGSWNRSQKVGYDILLVRFDAGGRVTGSEVFASGWLQGEEAWGRPNDVLQMPDGSLLVSDDKANAIYRITYSGG